MYEMLQVYVSQTLINDFMNNHHIIILIYHHFKFNENSLCQKFYMNMNVDIFLICSTWLFEMGFCGSLNKTAPREKFFSYTIVWLWFPLLPDPPHLFYHPVPCLFFLFLFRKQTKKKTNQNLRKENI